MYSALKQYLQGQFWGYPSNKILHFHETFLLKATLPKATPVLQQSLHKVPEMH